MLTATALPNQNKISKFNFWTSNAGNLLGKLEKFRGLKS